MSRPKKYVKVEITKLRDIYIDIRWIAVNTMNAQAKGKLIGALMTLKKIIGED